MRSVWNSVLKVKWIWDSSLWKSEERQLFPNRGDVVGKMNMVSYKRHDTGKKGNSVRQTEKRSFKSSEGQLCKWTRECRRCSAALKLPFLKNLVSRNWSNYIVPCRTLWIKYCCLSHFLECAMYHIRGSAPRPGWGNVFLINVVCRSQRFFLLPPLPDHAFSFWFQNW